MRYVRGVLTLAAVANVAACARPDWTDPETSKGSRDVPPTAAARVVPTVDTPPPPSPRWVAPLLGKPLRAVFPREGVCIGNTDGVSQRYAGQPARAMLVGWAWEVAARAPAPRIVLVDSGGLIVGGGRTGVARPDVMAAKPAVTSEATGWQALSPVLTGSVGAYGVIEGGRAVCPLGGTSF